MTQISEEAVLVLVAETLTGGLGRAVAGDSVTGLASGRRVYVLAPVGETSAFPLPRGIIQVDLQIPDRLSKIGRSIRARRQFLRFIKSVNSRNLFVHAEGIRSGIICVGKYSNALTIHGQGAEMGIHPVRTILRSILLRVLSRCYEYPLSVMPESRGKWNTLWFTSTAAQEFYWKTPATPKPEESLTMAWLGRVAPPKRFRDFTRIYEEIKLSGVPVKALIAGEIDDEYLPEVSRFESDSEFQILGHVTNLDEFLSQDVVVCLFSESEGKTFAIEESISRGRPVIVSDLPGHRMMISRNEFIAGSTKEAATKLKALASQERAGLRSPTRKLGVLMVNEASGPSDYYFPTCRIAGLPFIQTDVSELVRFVLTRAAVTGRNSLSFHFVPAGSVYFAELDARYRNLLENSICVPDGKSISVISRFTKSHLNQIRGVDLFSSLLDQSQGSGIRHFLYGTSVENLQVLKDQIYLKYPTAHVAGMISPSFGPIDESELTTHVAEIERVGTQILWIGLSSPKQDFVASYFSNRLGIPVLAVGAAFDFMSGAQRESPKWVSKIGMEWLYRFGSNPKRLWRRYLVGNFVFLITVLRYAAERTK